MPLSVHDDEARGGNQEPAGDIANWFETVARAPKPSEIGFRRTLETLLAS